MDFMTLFLISIAVLAIVGGRAHAVKSTGLLTKGLRSEFFARLETTPTHFGHLATRVVSDNEKEFFKFLGGVPQVREFGTGRLAKGLRTESYDIKNLKYESTIEVDRDEISDDQTGQIALRINEMAQRAARHKDFLIASLLEDGTAGLCYDGLSFFNDAHVSGASGNQDNKLTYGCAVAGVPTVAEFKEALKTMIQAMMGFKDDQGEPMMTDVGGMVLAVPPAMFFTASESVNATVIGNTDNVLKGIARVISFPWLTATDKCYLLKTDAVIRPFIFQDREPIEFTSLDNPDSEEAFMREKYYYGVRARYRMAYGYWQYAVLMDFN